MSKMLLFSLSILVLLVPSLSHTDDDLIVVNNRVWDEIQRYDGYNTSLVLFYDPKCPYCQRTLPEFKKAAKIIKQRGLDVSFGKVDLAIIPDLGTKANIQKVPTIFYFNNGEEMREISAHTFDEIVNFIMNAFHFHSVELTTMEEASKLMLESENVAIFYGKSTDEEYTVYRAYLELHEPINMAFAHIFSSKLIKELDLPENNHLTIIRKADKTNVYYDLNNSFTVANLKQFIDMEVHPPVAVFKHRILQDFLKKHYPLLLLVQKEDHKKSENALKAFEEGCKDLRSTIQCATMFNKDEIEVTVMEMLGLKEEALPKMRIIRAKTNESFWKYKPKKEKVTVEHIKEFVNEFQRKEIEHYYRSEPVPEYNSGPIKIVVRDNFKSLVMDPTKDVLLVFHAPWCNHCTKVSVVMKSLAQSLKSVENLVFAEADVSTNDFEEMTVLELPTIYFYASVLKSHPIKFEAQVSRDNLIGFLKMYMTVERTNALLKDKVVKEDL